jgi:hypothetical protein
MAWNPFRFPWPVLGMVEIGVAAVGDRDSLLRHRLAEDGGRS